MPWIKNIAPSLYFTSNSDVDKITFKPGVSNETAAITVDAHGAPTQTNWAFRVLSLEQAKKIGLTDAKYQAARNSITLAGDNYKRFMKSILMTETVQLKAEGGSTPPPLKGLTGVNYTTLKHASWSFSRKMFDPTKLMVWSYKLIWEAYLNDKKKKGTSAKDIVKEFNNSKEWANLASALTKQRQSNRVAFVTGLLKKRGIEIYDSGKAMGLLGPPAGGDFPVHAAGLYAQSPVKRFRDDKMVPTAHYGKGGFVPEWLDRLALTYIPRKYYLPFKSDTRGGALPRYQHDAWASGKLVQYRSKAWEVFKPAWSDLPAKKMGARLPYDAVIQQSLETDSAWSNLGFDKSGTEHLFKNAGSSLTSKQPYYSAYNPVYPYKPNDIKYYRNDPKTFFQNINGWAPFSPSEWYKIGTAKSPINVEANEQWKDVFSPTGVKNADGDRTDGETTFGIAGLKEVCDEVKSYYSKQYKYGGSPYDRAAVFAFLRTGPRQANWKAGKLAFWTNDFEVQQKKEKEALERWKKALDYLWDKGLNMGYSTKKGAGLGSADEAYVWHGVDDSSPDVSKWKKTAGWIKNGAGLRQRYGGQKKPINLLNPLYRVEASSVHFAFIFRLMVFILDAYNTGQIPQQKAPGASKIAPFANNGGNAEMALYMAIDIIWSLFYEFNKQDKKIKAVKDANASIPKDSKMVVSGKGVRGQIMENMQCFMLNLVDVFAKFHKVDPPVVYSTVVGDNTNIFNLLGYKPETIDMLLRMNAQQLARMQPRIKLYKERTIYKKNSNIVLKREAVEVAGPMTTYTSIKNIEESLAQGSGRNLGGGIKEVVLKEGSGDMVNADVPSDDHIEITFLFNTLQEIFLNFPRYDDNGKHAGFPYGIQPRHAHLKPEDVPASYAELVFPSSRGQKDEYIQVVNTFREDFNIILEMGWSPPDNLKNLTPYEKAVFDKLREATLYRTFVLQPIDSEFNFTNEGQVELKATYKGVARYNQSKSINRLFPLGGMSDSAKLSDDKEVIAAKKTIVKYTKQQQGKAKGKSTILSAVESAELARARTLIRGKIDMRQAAEFDNFVRDQLDDLMKAIFSGYPKGNIYILHVPSALLGARGSKVSDGVIKWQTTRDIELLKQFPKNVTRSNGRETKKGHQRDISTKTMDAAKKASKSNSPAELEARKKAAEEVARLTKHWSGSKEDLKKEIEKIRKKYKVSEKKISTNVRKAAQKTMAEKGKEHIGSNTSGTWPIYFMFYGDVIEGVFEFSSYELSKLQKRINQVISSGAKKDANINFKKNIHEHTRLILGSVKIPIVSGGKSVNHNINIQDLPMTTHFFTQFVIDTLITPGAYGITKIDFCEKLLKRLVYQYFNSKCFFAGSEVAKTSPQMHYFTVPQLDKKSATAGALWRHHLDEGVGFGKAFTRESFKKRMIEIEKKLNSSPELSKAPHFKYAFLGTRSFAEGSFDYQKDLAQNIHHFYFGAGEGLVKTVSFKSEDMEHMTEAIFYGGVQLPGTEIDAFIPRIFNVDVTMIGNTLFRPGHTFYLDPTMGTMLGAPGKGKKKGIDVIKNTGLGGYFYVASIETRIAPGVYETTLEGVKTGMHKNKDRARAKGFTPASAEELMERTPPVKVPQPGSSGGSGGGLWGAIKKGAKIVF